MNNCRPDNPDSLTVEASDKARLDDHRENILSGPLSVRRVYKCCSSQRS